MKHFILAAAVCMVAITGCTIDSINDSNAAPAAEQNPLSREYGYTPRITVPDTPPVVTVSASVMELWPPNKKWQTVTFSGTLADYTTASYVLTDEYGKISYSGTLTGATFSVPLALKAEQKGKDKDGRVYAFTVTAVGTLAVEASVTVVVPHNKKEKDHDDDKHDDHHDNDGDDD